MPRVVRVWAPSRLHFGLLSYGQQQTRRYGGAGVMIDRPGLTLALRPAPRLTASGPLAERVLAFAERYMRGGGASAPLGCHLEIEAAPPEHAGLGTGTQLGLAVAAGLDAWQQRTDRSAADWARLVGRGERSAIGTHGFQQGGLLVEGGKRPGECVSPLVARLELPAAWRFVLVVDRRERGLSGDDERQAFGALPEVTDAATAELCRELLLELLPAAATADVARFGESLYRYGHQAGLMFAKQQGGPYAGRRGAAVVEWFRAAGVQGVGQSSWGPAIFALVPDAPAAESLVARVERQFPPDEFFVFTAGPANHGARVECQ